jgi:hypothetical protein
MTRENLPGGVGRKVLAVGVLGAGGALLVAGCGSSSTSTMTHSPSPSASASGVSAATCVHINSLRTSLTHLTTLKISASSAGQLTSDLTNIQTQLNALKGQNVGSFSAQEGQLASSLTQIKQSSAQLATNPTAASKSLSKELTTLKTNSGPMIAEMKTVCKSS